MFKKGKYGQTLKSASGIPLYEVLRICPLRLGACGAECHHGHTSHVGTDPEKKAVRSGSPPKLQQLCALQC